MTMSYQEFLDKLDDLRTRMVGKSVVSIEPPGVSEAICKFIMDDGSAFRLHATELGFWIEDTVATSETLYSNLDGLHKDFEHHTWGIPNYDFETKGPKIVVINNTLIVETNDGRQFKADITKFNKWERSICSHSKGLKLLKSSLINFLNWKLNFSDRNKKCPKELYFVESSV